MVPRGFSVGTVGRTRTWFKFMFRWTLRIRCFDFFNTCKYRSKFMVALLFKNSVQGPFTLPEDASHDFSRRSLRLGFILPCPPNDPDLAPSDLNFLGAWRVHSKDVDLPTTRSYDTVCVNNSDALANSFTRPTYSVSRKCRKIVLIVTETLWKNNINLERNVLKKEAHFIIILNTVYNYINTRHYLRIDVRKIKS